MTTLDYDVVYDSLVTADPVTVDIYISTSDSPSKKDIIESKTEIKASGAFGNTCKLMAANEKLIIKSSLADVVVRVAALTKPVDTSNTTV